MNPADIHEGIKRIEAELDALKTAHAAAALRIDSAIPAPPPVILPARVPVPVKPRASVVIVWHNRPKNLEYWLHIMARTAPHACTFTVIHNCETPSAGIREMVESAGARYVARQNTGMDVGSFQDVCRKRLKGFDYDYDHLLWFTDDCFPMSVDFVSRFIQPFSDAATGMTCLEVSTQIRRHVRTTGFCLPRAAVENMRFQVDPVKTKQDCYQFEHRGPATLYEQVLAAGKKVVQVAALSQSPAWDSGGGGHGWLNRRQEFERIWEIGLKGSKVLVICPAFERYPGIVASMILQTYHNWELYLVHDGPAPTEYPRFSDPRIHFIEEGAQGPRKNFGHPIREQYLQKIKEKRIEGDYVVVTNDDNYHAPFFLEKLVKALDENPQAPGAFCSHMTHNYATFPGQTGVDLKDGHAVNGYAVLPIKPERGHIDCAAVMIRAAAAGAVGWPDYSHSSDWTFLNRIAQQNGGWDRFKCVPGALLVHN